MKYQKVLWRILNLLNCLIASLHRVRVWWLRSPKLRGSEEILLNIFTFTILSKLTLKYLKT